MSEIKSAKERAQKIIDTWIEDSKICGDQERPLSKIRDIELAIGAAIEQAEAPLNARIKEFEQQVELWRVEALAAREIIVRLQDDSDLGEYIGLEEAWEAARKATDSQIEAEQSAVR